MSSQDETAAAPEPEPTEPTTSPEQAAGAEPAAAGKPAAAKKPAAKKPADQKPAAKKTAPKKPDSADEGDDVPWPDEWLEESRKRIVAATLALTIAVGVAAIFCYRRWQDESYGQSIALGFLAIIGAAWLRYVVVIKLRNRWKPLEKLAVEDVPDVDERGVVFHYAPVIYRVYWTSLILVTLLGIGITAGLIWLGIEDDWTLWIYLEIVVMALLVAYSLRFLLEFARRQVQPGMLGLTPRGVYHRSWTFSGFMPWEHVESVSPVDVSGPVVLVSAKEEDFLTPIQQTSKMWKQGELELVPDLAVRGRWLAVDAAVAFHAVNYYFTNPAARAELGTDAGAARIREQRLLTDAPSTSGKSGSA